MEKEEAESARNIRLLQQQQRDLEERIDQALEMMLDRRLPKDKLVSKLQGDEKRLAKITDELEHYGAKTVLNQRDLNAFRQQLNDALDQAHIMMMDVFLIKAYNSVEPLSNTLLLIIFGTFCPRRYTYYVG